MKYILIIFKSLVIFSSCNFQEKDIKKRIEASIDTEKPKEITEIDSVLYFNQSATIKKNFSFIDTIEPLQLSIGNKLLIDFKFPVEWNFGDIYDRNRIINENEKSINKLLGFYEGYIPENYKIKKKRTYSIDYFLDVKHDYRNAITENGQIKDYGIARLPDTGDSIKVLGIWFSKDNLDQGREFPWSVAYGDIITIKNGEVLDRLTIERFEGNHSLGGDYRRMYIDENYIIHTKDFYYGENQGNFIRYCKWKIKENGKIVEYLDEDKLGIKKEGEIKNRMKTGMWKEITPNKFFAALKKSMRIESCNTFSEGNYNEGEKIGEWKYYSFDNFKKGILIYKETYKGGELVKRTFVE
ncbi:hypothetical protein [Aquimarina pacifica]|uniref:hypothetical protein n=1 Tax=Aquimarina pacifica TaxID=1296415 RepID=UPI00046EB88A|nr:hypothetical protein [Aquimarina pacifica]